MPRIARGLIAGAFGRLYRRNAPGVVGGMPPGTSSRLYRLNVPRITA